MESINNKINVGGVSSSHHQQNINILVNKELYYYNSKASIILLSLTKGFFYVKEIQDIIGYDPRNLIANLKRKGFIEDYILSQDDKLKLKLLGHTQSSIKQMKCYQITPTYYMFFANEFNYNQLVGYSLDSVLKYKKELDKKYIEAIHKINNEELQAKHHLSILKSKITKTGADLIKIMELEAKLENIQNGK